VDALQLVDGSRRSSVKHRVAVVEPGQDETAGDRLRQVGCEQTPCVTDGMHAQGVRNSKVNTQQQQQQQQQQWTTQLMAQLPKMWPGTTDAGTLARLSWHSTRTTGNFQYH